MNKNLQSKEKTYKHFIEDAFNNFEVLDKKFVLNIPKNAKAQNFFWKLGV